MIGSPPARCIIGQERHICARGQVFGLPSPTMAHRDFLERSDMTKIRKAAGDKQSPLKRLAAYGPVFRHPTTVFGARLEMIGKGKMRDPYTFPSFEYSDVANRFQKMLYDAGWIQDFDWPEWKDGPEGKKLFGHGQAIATADCDQLAKLLTTLVRQDRFVEGLLAKAYEDKILLAIVERAESLVASTDPV
jgi:hypothetical protein